MRYNILNVYYVYMYFVVMLAFAAGKGHHAPPPELHCIDQHCPHDQVKLITWWHSTDNLLSLICYYPALVRFQQSNCIDWINCVIYSHLKLETWIFLFLKDPNWGMWIQTIQQYKHNTVAWKWHINNTYYWRKAKSLYKVANF